MNPTTRTTTMVPNMRKQVIGIGVLILAAYGCSSGDPAPKTGSTPKAIPAATPAPASSDPVAFTVTALELAKAYDADKEAYAAKYAGKRIELSGQIITQRPAGPGMIELLLEGDPIAKDALARMVVVGPRKVECEKYQGLKALAKGQTVTVRGEVPKFGVMVGDCEFVSAGPSPALPVTPSGLLAALKTDEGKKKYENKDVVLRGEVRKAAWNGSVVRLAVSDPGVEGGPTLEASISPASQKAGDDLLMAVKPGAVVVLLGEAQTTNDGRIWDFRVLTEPPEGVVLPAGMKK